MIIYTEKDAWECEAAEQYLDGVHLLDADRQIIVVICDIHRILKVEDGEIKIVENPEINDQEKIVINSIEQPSQIDRIEAQVTYTAMMTDTLLP